MPKSSTKFNVTDKKVILRELGRSHIVITISSLIILGLLLNESYRFIDASGDSYRAALMVASGLVGLVVLISIAILARVYSVLKK